MRATAHLYEPTPIGLAGLALTLLFASLASLYLIAGSCFPVPVAEWAALAQGPFCAAVLRSLTQLGLVVALSVPIGIGLGLLFTFGRRGRGILLLPLLVPVMAPPFLWAIGWSNLRRFVAYKHQIWFDGLSGCTLTLTSLNVPLVAMATILAAQTLSNSHLDAIRLAGGFWTLARHQVRYVFPLALAVGVLGGIFLLMDPGPAQIMGYHGVASEVLIEFSARHDFHAAALKACAFLLILCPFVVWFGWQTAIWVETEMLGRDAPGHPFRLHSRWSGWVTWALGLVSCLIVLPAALGIVWPALGTNNRPTFDFVFGALLQSAPTTLFYAGTAGLVATAFGLFAAVCAARSPVRRLSLLAFGCLFIAVPSSLHALGVAALTTKFPACFDAVCRSGWIVGVAQGLRFVPMAALLCLGAWSRIPRSAHYAAACHGVPVFTFLWKVGLPQMLPVLVVSTLAVGFLSAADVPSLMLLQPPGAVTFPGRLFVIMDNASERLVSAFCLVYLLAGIASAMTVYLLARRRLTVLF